MLLFSATPIPLHAASKEEDIEPSLTRTSLFRVNMPDSHHSLYVLGSIHSKHHATYPSVIHQTIHRVLQERGHLFTEIDFEKESAYVGNLLEKFNMKNWCQSLEKSATLLGKNPAALTEWEKTYQTWFKTRPKKAGNPLLNEEYTPHPSFLHLKLKDAETEEDEAAELSGMDHYACHLFPEERRHGLETEEDRLAVQPSLCLDNFLVFEQDVEQCLTLFSSEQKSNHPNQKEKNAHMDQIQYEFSLENPLADVSRLGSAHVQERNALWRKRLDSYLSDPLQHSLLFVVGTFHLGGPTGLLPYFSEKGMPIFRIYEDQNKTPVEKEFVVDPQRFDDIQSLLEALEKLPPMEE